MADLKVLTDKLESIGYKKNDIITFDDFFRNHKDLDLTELLYLRPNWFEKINSNTQKFIELVENANR